MKKLIILVIIYAVLFSGCNRKDCGIMLGDLLNINGITFVCHSISVPDERAIGKMVSRVKERIAGQKIASGYRLKDGDSVNLKKGTPVYEIKGVDAEDMVSAKWEGGLYLVYINQNKSDKIIDGLRDDIEKAIGVRIKNITPGNEDMEKEIYDFDLVDSIKMELINAGEYEGQIDDLSKLYSMEFLIPYDDGIYKPCLRLVFRAGNKDGCSIFYDNGIKLAGQIVKNIIAERY